MAGGLVNGEQPQQKMKLLFEILRVKEFSDPRKYYLFLKYINNTFLSDCELNKEVFLC
jgi:hypothetical protein